MTKTESEIIKIRNYIQKNTKSQHSIILFDKLMSDFKAQEIAHCKRELGFLKGSFPIGLTDDGIINKINKRIADLEKVVKGKNEKDMQ